MNASTHTRRPYQDSHPWITFSFNLRHLNPLDWINVGEAWSKCDHIAGVPLQPQVAQRLHEVYLAKGVHATTQIEGNTLSEDEVRQRVEGDLELPESQEYLGTEVDNILRACGMIADDLAAGRDMRLTPERIKLFNQMVLDGLPLKEGIMPGEIRTDSVVVGSVYRGAPWQDCEDLLKDLCTWLDAMVADVDESWRRPMKLIRAILAHLYLAWIHPFGDGNGRTARLVEFQLLADAGFPSPACHLLSNYYNRTRQMYYRVLAETSRPPYPVDRFVSYALRGFVEELREQLKVVRHQQLSVAWINYVHETFSGLGGNAAQRQRELVLALPPNTFTPVPNVRRLTPELAEQYAGKQQKTITRDVNAIVKLGLVHRGRTGIRPRIELLSAFLPIRQRDTPED
ncbi:Fic family protein [Micromonospora tulbaghiae]|uniref:Fic family protein n=1 Tax=Micromonospora tulbaghiae TaxID=479978 RepID=UPI00342AE7B7